MSDLFLIRGGDRKEYGPVPTSVLTGWIQEGRADRLTPTRVETSTDWRPLSDFPDLVAALPAPAPQGRPLFPSAPSPLPSAEEIRARGYRLQVLDYLADGWQLLVRQPGPVLGAGVLATLGVLILALATFIPFAAFITVPAAFLLSGPVCGGLSHLCVRAWRGQRMRVRDALDGFRHHYLPLLLAFHSVALRAALMLIPGMAILAAGVSHAGRMQSLTPVGATCILGGIAVMVLGAAAATALWGFTPALVADRNLGVLEASRLSRQTVLRHPFQHLRLTLDCGILLFGGLVFFGVGLLLTLPWVIAIRARTYDELFGPRHAPSR